MVQDEQAPLVETMRRIDLATLRRDEPSLTAGHRLQVSCQRNDGEKVDVANVYLESTRMYFGGRRLGFHCPRYDNQKRINTSHLSICSIRLGSNV